MIEHHIYHDGVDGTASGHSFILSDCDFRSNRQKLTIPGAPDPAPIRQVDMADGALWALEAKAINRFDGTSWERFESPFA